MVWDGLPQHWIRDTQMMIGCEFHNIGDRLGGFDEAANQGDQE